MPFRRHKKEQRQKQLAQSEVIDLNAWFSSRIDEVNLIRQADKRLLKLVEISDEIDGFSSERRLETNKKAGKKGARVFLGSTGAQMGIVTGLTIASGGALAPLFLLPATGGMLGSLIAGDKAASSAKKRLNLENKDITTALQSFSQIIVTAQNDILARHLNEIARSALKADIFSRSPSLKERFSEAAARKLVEDSNNSAKKHTPPRGPGF